MKTNESEVKGQLTKVNDEDEFISEHDKSIHLTIPAMDATWLKY